MKVYTWSLTNRRIFLILFFVPSIVIVIALTLVQTLLSFFEQITKYTGMTVLVYKTLWPEKKIKKIIPDELSEEQHWGAH